MSVCVDIWQNLVSNSIKRVPVVSKRNKYKIWFKLAKMSHLQWANYIHPAYQDSTAGFWRNKVQGADHWSSVFRRRTPISKPQPEIASNVLGSSEKETMHRLQSSAYIPLQALCYIINIRGDVSASSANVCFSEKSTVSFLPATETKICTVAF